MKLGRLFDLTFILIIAMFIMTSCGPSGSSNSSSSSQTAAKLSINLTDAPNDDLQNVFVNVKEVELRLSKGKKSALVHVAKGMGIVDLLQLQNGITLMMDELEIPHGVTVDHIRLILDEGHFAIRKDGSQCDLRTPSAEQSGLKLQAPATVIMHADYNFSLVVDFDAKQSIVQLGNGDCLLKPVLKMAKATRKAKHKDSDGRENVMHEQKCALSKTKSGHDKDHHENNGHHEDEDNDHDDDQGENHNEDQDEHHGDDNGHSSEACEIEEDLMPADGSTTTTTVPATTTTIAPVATTTTLAPTTTTVVTTTTTTTLPATTTTIAPIETTTTIAPTTTTAEPTQTTVAPIVDPAVDTPIIDRTGLENYFNIQ